jgi:hypothetical protein
MLLRSKTARPWPILAAIALVLCEPALLHAQTTAPSAIPPAQSSQNQTTPNQNPPAATGPATPSPAERSESTASTSPSNASEPTLQPAPKAQPSNTATTAPMSNDVILDNADHVHVDEQTNVVTASGNVRIRYRGYTFSSDTASIDTNNNEAEFSGHITLKSSDSKTQAMGAGPNSKVRLNLHSGAYSLLGGESAVISPQDLPASGLLLPLRLFGGDINGDSSVVDARNAMVTTCDFPEPHYVFGARTITIVPGKHLIARHVTLYRKGHPVVTLPVIWLPLSNRYSHQNLTPLVGYSPDEGYFAKFAEPYVLTAAALGVLRLDLMQYKGVGTGLDQSYSLHSNPASSQGGTIKLYHLYDNALHLNSLTGSWTHNQSLFDGFTLGINSQYQQNSYYLSTGQSQSLNSQISLIRTTPDASTNFTSNWQRSDFGSGLESNLSSSLFQHEVLSKTSHIDFKFNYAEFQTLSSFAGASSSSQSLTSNVDFLTNPKGYSVELLIDQFNSLGSAGAGTTSSLSGVEKLPELKLQTDPAGSPGTGLWSQILPRLSKLLLDLGEFSEGISGMHTNRLEFGLDLGNHSDRRGALTNTYTGSFQQYFYGDNTAQYILNGQAGYQYAFQRQSSFGVKYSYLRPYGFTPFFFDQSGFYNNASATLNYNPNHKLQLSLGTGYDFTRDKSEFGLPAAPWQNLLAELTLKPTKDFGTQIEATYDPNHGQLFDVTDTIQARASDGFAFNSSARYDPQQSMISEIDSSLDLPIILDKHEDAGYRIQALEGYNGFTKTFTYKGLSLTRSWHDWELSAVYEDIPNGVRPGQTFYLNFRLKAFPGYQPFGVGQSGQGLDTGIGEIL